MAFRFLACPKRYDGAITEPHVAGRKGGGRLPPFQLLIYATNSYVSRPLAFIPVHIAKDTNIRREVVG